jgi:sodium-dependent phosphate transporter
MALTQYNWILALITICLCVSSFGNGANDVANSYATSVAARSLTMVQVGFLSICTEFVGAVALGANVTSTIKNSIISIKRFEGSPGALILGMACAEFGSAFWLILSTRLGLPVSTTQSTVGALIGVGIAAGAPVQWKWAKGSVSQIAASWAISPAISAGFASVIFLILKFSVLERRDPLKWGMRLVPFYFSTTAAILALFIICELPKGPSLQKLGASKACAVIFGVWGGVLAISYIFFVPYFHRRVVNGDTRVRLYHLPLGPTLWKDDCWLYYPSKADRAVLDYYDGSDLISEDDNEKVGCENGVERLNSKDAVQIDAVANVDPSNLEHQNLRRRRPKPIEPEELFLAPTKDLPLYHPKRIWSICKYVFLQGVTRNVIYHDSTVLDKVHSRAKRYDSRVEHLWTYVQIASAMMMSIAHGSNDIANAVGPWSAAYSTYVEGNVATKSPVPIWILAAAGLLLGIGFWFMGYHIIRTLGNRITQMSPTRGFSMELGAAVTVLLASQLGIPVSTTQCIAGAVVGVALMNFDLQAVNWRQIAWIFSGWIFTLPTTALISGLLMAMALNAPKFVTK